MVSVSILAIGAGAAFIYAAWRCVKLTPLLRGDYQEGDHCTGSLIVIAGALLLAILSKIGSGGGWKIPIPVPGGGKPKTPPPPEEPPPGEVPPVEIPPAIP